MLTPYCGALNNTACEECCLLLHNTQSSAALTPPPLPGLEHASKGCLAQQAAPLPQLCRSQHQQMLRR